MKRKHISDNTRSKKPKLVGSINSDISSGKLYISATDLYNYMIKDPLVDWLKLKGFATRIPTGEFSFKTFLMEKGDVFEREIVKHISHKVPVITVSKYISAETCQRVIDLMREGVPVIHSAPVQNHKNMTQGVIDLVVRSDILNTITTEASISPEELTCGKNGYHYVVVDIKFSGIPLRADNKHILNSGNYPAYKAQCLIYTQAIGIIQGYTAPYAFILGRGSTSANTSKNINAFERLGKIDFEGVDHEYKNKVSDGLDWLRDLGKYGNNWSYNPPSRIELLPNMCVDSGQWNKEKERIAAEIGDITSIWYCGIKQRDNAFEQGVYTWRDKLCTSKTMKIKGNRSSIIDQILNINRQKKEVILPKKIKGNYLGWKTKNKPQLYVDFETISNVFSDFTDLPNQSERNMIFMIGVGWVENDKWYYKNFTCAKLTLEEEYRICDEFVKFTEKYKKIWYWSADHKIWRTCSNRQYDRCDEEQKAEILNNWKFVDEKWSDLAMVFQEVPIVIKGCFSFKLKSIAESMRSHGMISAKIDSDCKSGMDAMVSACKFYSNNSANLDLIRDIAKYNEFDCKVLYEILSFLREKYT